jgi:molecular chaperone DnaK (HSP70)
MWTKLELDNRRVGEVAKIAKELSSSGGTRREPVDIVADFLAQVKIHLIKNLDNKFGEELWRTLNITLVVTVPAVWSDVAKHRTLQAIDKAGFNVSQFPQLKTPILVTTEPEAAALYTMRTLRGTAQNEQLAVGDGFIVCDMGGGTVDLISYRVKSLQPTVIEEATIGNGAQCGGSFVDRAFLRWLEGRLGTSDFVKIAGCRSEEIPRVSLNKKSAKILQDFTMEVKTGFSGSEIGYLVLPNPLSAIEEDKARGIRDGEITVTA